MSERTKWAVWIPATGKYVAAPGGEIQWTYDRLHAAAIAVSIGGEIVDAEVLRYRTFPTETSGPILRGADALAQSGEK